ncbi:MAG: DUF63 family protein [Methanobacteriaceae archaeon]|jgi:uncharacterized membrane protein
MLDSISQFIQDNFLYLHSGYTPFNTIVFGIILGIVVILVIKMLKHIKKDPGYLFIPLLPFILFGSSARALVDNGIYPHILWLVTPGIYILTGFITIATLLISVYVENKTNFNYRYLMFIAGAILCIPNIISINHINWVAFFEVTGTWAVASSIFLLLRNKWSLLKDKFNSSALSAQLFDASSTFIAVDFYGYSEQHVLPNVLIGLAGTASVMFPLKIAVILAALYVIEEYIEDNTIKNMLKLAIFILGLAPGLRNFLSLSMGT